MCDEILENGLTTEQSEKAKKILLKVSIRKIANIIGTNDTAIHNVLRGQSSNIALLDRALKEANKIIAEKQKLIENLPL